MTNFSVLIVYAGYGMTVCISASSPDAHPETYLYPWIKIHEYGKNKYTCYSNIYEPCVIILTIVISHPHLFLHSSLLAPYTKNNNVVWHSDWNVNCVALTNVYPQLLMWKDGACQFPAKKSWIEKASSIKLAVCPLGWMEIFWVITILDLRVALPSVVVIIYPALWHTT